ncbi:MAG: hypothetical protein HS104_36935 [Polyangiaceae bacterium]|nr:hypothetical protein [Polyangiaceae bacterium]MBK9001935.1 hypothetical protein [Myxococcales bacterium]MCL4751096.1 hypothetical protein [Myxococcales bacterium]
MVRFGISAALALGVVAMAGTARAEVESTERTSDGDRYVFRDDLLNSDVGFPAGARITVRPLAGRVLLIRPRTSFVREMFKSVEKM